MVQKILVSFLLQSETKMNIYMSESNLLQENNKNKDW